ncbi:MAG: tetratricopeptide repeat protein [Phycisphaerales bacterium]|nr:MAG: tetratricopeptide repeat protein [Phycisphaerales bacterium]
MKEKQAGIFKGLLFLVIVMAIPQSAHAVRNIKVGDSVPSFFLPRADGTVGLYPSEQLIGQPAAIIFWRPNHELSLEALRDLEAVAQEVGPSKFKILAVDAKLSSVQNVQAALVNEKISFPIVLDPLRTLYEKVGLIVCPTTLLFDAKGTLQFVVTSHARQFRQVVKARLRFFLGEIDEETMNEHIKPSIHRIEPDLAAAWRMYNLGVQLQTEGRIDEATSIFEKVIAQYPSLAEAHCALGFLKFAAGDPNSAAERFQTALKHNPSLHQAQLGWGIILARTGEGRKAEQILLPLVGHRSIAARTRYELGRIYSARGERDKALKFFRDSLALIFPEPGSAGATTAPVP